MNLHIKETGKENPETILFLHEDNMAGWMWDEQVKAFQDYHCIVPDLPEHGGSHDSVPFTIEDAARMIIDIIRNKAHNDKAHLVGISMGAQVILQILSTTPEVVDHALISGALVNTSPHNETFLKLLDYLIKKYIPVKNDNLSIGSYIRSYNIPKGLSKKFKESTYVIQPDSAERIIREKILFEMPSNLENVEVPVLIIAGEKEYKVIKESLWDLVNIFTNSKAYFAPGVGHMWNIENPELFNRVLRSWIQDEELTTELEISA